MSQSFVQDQWKVIFLEWLERQQKERYVISFCWDKYVIMYVVYRCNRPEASVPRFWNQSCLRGISKCNHYILALKAGVFKGKHTVLVILLFFCLGIAVTFVLIFSALAVTLLDQLVMILKGQDFICQCRNLSSYLGLNGHLILPCAVLQLVGEERVGRRMSAERCAELYALTIANNLSETWIAENPVLALLYAAQYLPLLAAK